MQTIFADRARTPSGWLHNLRLSVADGKIAKLEADQTPQPSDVKVDTLLPSLANLHSHSFQRAMAGMTEVRAAGKDSFLDMAHTDVSIHGTCDAGTISGHRGPCVHGNARGRICLGR